MKDAPGTKWLWILGAAGFAAGFAGPMLLAPEANQGPMAGIFISGPGGVALGAILFGLCSLFRTSAQTQWRLLSGVTVTGVITTLIAVLPPPERQGKLFEAQVLSCVAPRDVEAETNKFWTARIADATWAQPRDHWQQDMHDTLWSGDGAVLKVRVLRESIVFENRKPWNRGSIFAGGWRPATVENEFYRPSDSCDVYPVGNHFTGYEAYLRNDAVAPPKAWPPSELADILVASTFTAVPERFKPLQ
jgi:hypothetical protein